MRVSEYFDLGRTQPELDFVDVDIYGDVPLFLDPRAIRLLENDWGAACVSLIQDFFTYLLTLIRAGNSVRASRLLASPGEPNETHLGLSSGRARGRGMGPELGTKVHEALAASEAIKTGLLEDLEETVLMVENISFDRVSDIATNIMRGRLIQYTQDMAEEYSIPLTPDVDSGPVWEPTERRWIRQYVQLPRTKYGKLLLVPKAIVRRKLNMDPGEYYNGYVLEELREFEFSNPAQELVVLLKNGKMVVRSKDLIDKYGQGKRRAVEYTKQYPRALERYRADKSRDIKPGLNNWELAEAIGTPPPQYGSLLGAVLKAMPGKADADIFHRAVQDLFTALFDPCLVYPHREVKIHDGRKRIDITFANMQTEGFFKWVGANYSAQHIIIECKNYSGDPSNPELDQLSGRFSPSRGKVGLLVCRNFDDKERFIQRCRDTAMDQRGFIIPLDDDDLSALVEAAIEGGDAPMYEILKDRFDRLIL